MSVASTNEVTNNSIYTAQNQAKTDTATGAASENLTSTDFLNLLTESLKCQDPMDPTDNSEFISQECQFAQLTQSQDTNTTLSSSQALNLVGKNVTINDPNNSNKTITGSVTSAAIDGSSSTITINGTEYPISDLKTVNEATTATTATTTTTK